MWHEAGLTGTHTCGKHMARATSCPILLFTLPLSFSPCFPVQLATFAYGGSCNFCRLLPLDAAHQNSLALATSSWSWKAVAAVRERELQSSVGPRCYHRYRWRLLPLYIVRARQSNTRTANATCHPPEAVAGTAAAPAAAEAAVPLATRSLAVPHCNKSCDFSQLKLALALTLAALLRRFSACFDFPSLPFLICHLKQKLPNLSLAWRGWFSHPSSLPRSSIAARRDVVCSLGCLGWLLVVWFVAFIKVA